jgi:Fe-S oxidoreductase
MWRVVHQYMDTMNGPADHLEVPKSPLTGTVFHNAKSTKMVHVTEFTADLIKNNKLKLDKSRNDHYTVTWHDSCNTSRGMGFLEEPRYVLNNVVNNFYEMPEQTIREQTFCCGSGSGLNAGENLEQRYRGGLPRANAVRYVHEKHGVNMLANVCAIDRASLKPLMDYWVPQVNVCGLSELVANALIMEGEKVRSTNMRGEEINDLREEAGLEPIEWPEEGEGDEAGEEGEE